MQSTFNQLYVPLADFSCVKTRHSCNYSHNKKQQINNNKHKNTHRREQIVQFFWI